MRGHGDDDGPSPFVLAGLVPAIHAEPQFRMDHRVKPGGDGKGSITSVVSLRGAKRRSNPEIRAVLYLFRFELRGAAYRWPQPTLARLRRLLGASRGSYLTIQTSRPMRRVVFYSWQSDLPNATNRGLIQSALEVAKRVVIAGDDTVDVEPVIDRDTEGVAGSPDIASTIFGKIDASDIVVADVSIVSCFQRGKTRAQSECFDRGRLCARNRIISKELFWCSMVPLGQLKACHLTCECDVSSSTAPRQRKKIALLPEQT